MTDSADNLNRRLRFSLRKRGHQVEGHQVGDIRSDESVTIQAGAVLVGNVVAPKIRVAGLLFGTAVTHDLIIEKGGQIWGDVLAARLHTEPGSLIQGWISSLKPGENLPEEVPDPSIERPSLPSELAIHAPPTPDHSQLEPMHRLQKEAGTALAAFAELEGQFEAQLQERAGIAFDKAESLTTEMAAVTAKLAALQEQFEQAQATIVTQTTRIREQDNALSDLNEVDRRQKRQISDINQVYDQLTHEFALLQKSKNVVDLTLAQTQQEVDELNGRIQTLETTLQSSIQRTTEQEDALIHWQELAATHQSQLEATEKEQKNLREQLEESKELTGKLREKNSRLEFEWQQTLNEMDELRNRIPDISVEEMQFALADAQQQIATLKNIIGESDEKIIWHKANLETLQSTLEQSRKIAGHQESMLARLQADMAENETAVAKWKTAVEQMATRLQDQESQIESLKTSLSEEQAQAQEEIKALKEDVRDKTLQIESFESEIEHHLLQMDAQGQRLAEIQAILIERELELEQTEMKAARQADFIKRMKQVTQERMDQLETQLAQARNLLAQQNR